MRLLAVSAVLAIVIAACSSPPVGLAAEMPGTAWTLERVVLGDGSILRGDGGITFGGDGSIAVSSCNDCFGRYSLRDSLLTIDGALGCTKKACPTGAVELERHLEGTTTLSRDGAYLIATPGDSSGVQILLVPAEGES